MLEKYTFKINWVLLQRAFSKVRIDVLKLGIMKNSISKGVWQTYKNLVETDFASYFENEIYPEGFADIPATFHH